MKMLTTHDSPDESSSSVRTQAHAGPASTPLVAAALAGLLGLGAVTACGNDEPSGNTDSTPSSGGRAGSGGARSTGSASGAGGSEFYLNVISKDPMTPEAFAEECAERGGFVTTHAQCAGSNVCKGLSYNDAEATLTDHSCKALNSCSGRSCVVLPEDGGETGYQIYEEGPCAGCHNGADIGASTYVVFIREGEDAASALARFENSSDERLQAIVAFGTQGVHEDGTAFSNMPSYREKYSRAEIERVVEYLRGLEHSVEDYSGH